MNELDSLKELINRDDRFCNTNHMELVEISEGRAVARLNSGPDMLNANDVIQGGAIFTLADLAFAGAANSFPGLKCTSMTSTISFLRPGTGPFLTAKAEVVNKGKRSCLVEISVRDAEERLVARVATTGFFI